ncbi:MAG: GNAT family acetyltransferase [Chloroflexi bacterium]|nr:GNAT family acetyltransferase [Chloroflexota bacterium]
MKIRPFTLDDYDAVLDLWRRAGDGIRLRPSDQRAEIAKKLAHDPDLALVAVDDSGNPEKYVGAVMGGYDGRRGLVYHLAVDPAYRRQGIGRALMAELERRLRARGCLKCYLLLVRGNPEAEEFYRRQGWEDMTANIMLMGKELR